MYAKRITKGSPRDAAADVNKDSRFTKNSYGEFMTLFAKVVSWGFLDALMAYFYTKDVAERTRSGQN